MSEAAMQSTQRLVIVGGGMVGASLALALQGYARERQWELVLVEAFAPTSEFQPSYDARSTALSYGSRLIFERLGVWAAMAERAEPIRQIHVSDRGRFGAARLNAEEEHVPALGYVVENAWLGHCLLNALDTEVVQWRCPAQVTALTAQPSGYQLTLKEDGDDSVLHADLLVLADGGRSGLREQLGIGVRHTPYGQSALIANLTPAQPHQGQAFERFTDNGPMALLPVADNRCALVWTRPEEDAERLRTLDDRSLLAELQDAFGYRLGAIKQIGTRHIYPLALTEAEEQVRPHLVVLGNAAHSLHPIAGQGFNLSLRDTMALAGELLASETALGALAPLTAFHARQSRDQWLTIGFSDRVTRLFSNNDPLLSLGRGLGLVGLDVVPLAKHWFARQAMGLGVKHV
ncbi:2-octaprenyl-6-methoxyphenyl hydroxylase [Atopomonas sediminilitoris]|uniref:2-octaprenyl-6-methoxyphenyl hydroxylase n=1 Tax=Atopomonas sediminilitoris TaxID=2919919 RepID=UPI001F4EBDF0|nr:2-octaprenyl-6-methoxyphenyl hydroxylase [Atopomonas sediminilitoris]MCJ8168276.1 2-octaprenyl-6-methoxyphenyl hydroxylase [Atopomonas sediminilitoris]